MEDSLTIPQVRKFIKLEYLFTRALGRSKAKIDHPCISISDQYLEVGKLYCLKEKGLPVKAILLRRIRLNLDGLCIKVHSLAEDRSYWLRKSFDDLYSYESAWMLLDFVQPGLHYLSEIKKAV